jgi:oligogalacturonide transport system permease protein
MEKIMSKNKTSIISRMLLYFLLFGVAILMIYPLLWLLASSFKENSEIFTSISLFPKNFDFSSYKMGWKGTGKYTYTTYFINTFKMVIPTVIFTVLSTVLVGYGFARFNFPLKKMLFGLMISTLLLPQQVVMIPRYLLYKRFGWLDTYLPFMIPALLATNSFFIYLMIQFMRSIPKELDESAKIDGCNYFQILTKIIFPLCKPAIFSVIVFQFVWKWNDFFDPLIYINNPKNYTLSLALRSSLDVSETVAWNQLMALSVISMIPPIIIYSLAQRYFIEGITTTGLKG